MAVEKRGHHGRSCIKNLLVELDTHVSLRSKASRMSQPHAERRRKTLCKASLCKVSCTSRNVITGTGMRRFPVCLLITVDTEHFKPKLTLNLTIPLVWS